jgi:hypothetical protein
MKSIRATFVAVAVMAIGAGLMASPGASAAPPDPTKEQVWVKFVNESDRTIYLTRFTESKTERIYLNPGDKTVMWGSRPAKHDLSVHVHWCSDQKTFSMTCPGITRPDLKWKNPTIGYPWMEQSEYIYDDGSRRYVRIRFSVGESHTWYPDGRQSKVAILGTRLPDNGAKVWRVAFQNVS